ncbi:hypothetical protein [Paracoccus homiensis]|uniref:Uncharacterized protein n=1 Tax=Paracoccus homiensis TaxID=364199 RepID=A0A1I0BQY0_9RHOB|nr:hypothetical protein [Paracoccus homiensis]SET08691.1 hypothetical protein SAMN04489858_10312 [Paracoccus homiensis]
MTNIIAATISALPEGGTQGAAPPAMRIDLPVKPVLLPYCRRLVAAGVAPETVLHIYRGGTLCFVPTALGKFAGMATTESDTQSIRLTNYRQMPDFGQTVSPQSGLGASDGSGHPAGV